MKIAFAVGILGLILVSARPASAHEFPAPEVTVTLSEQVAGGHPTLQTIVDTPSGAGFDEVQVAAPPGSSIAPDAQIPDGTIVGRLDAEATTNAITAPQCNIPVTFSVPIREATTDTTAADYPPYLRTLAPGTHRTRLVADVSPSPEIPILVTYLIDINPLSKSLVSRIFVGDPAHPPSGFRSCTPGRSVITLFGTMPNGEPLFTAPNPLPQPKLAFQFTFTSRADAAGIRHTQRVDVVAAVAPTDRQPLAPPSVGRASPPVPEGPPAPSGLRLVVVGPTLRLIWQHSDRANEATQGFHVRVRVMNEFGQTAVLYTVDATARAFDLPAEFAPRCGGSDFVYGVDAFVTAGDSPFTEIPAPSPTCVRDRPPDSVLRLPLTGGGAALRAGRNRSGTVALVLAAVGMSFLAAAARRRGLRSGD